MKILIPSVLNHLAPYKDYKKVSYVLPEKIIKLIQQYVDGNYIYIPRKSENQKAGEKIAELKIYLKLRTMKFILSI